MDVTLTGQFWGWPYNLTGQLTQPWYVTYSPVIAAVLAAALSALLVSIANLYLDNKRNKKVVYQRQQQAYSELRGRNDIRADIYESYATAAISFNVTEAIRARTGIPSDQLMYKSRERWMRRVDKLTINNIPIEYGKLLETLSLISLIFENKAPAIENIEDLNRHFIETSVQDLSKKYRLIVPTKIAELDPPIRLNPKVPPAFNELSPDDTQRTIDLENSIMPEAKEELKREIERCIREPVNALLISMKSDLK